ncbi:unnamed protein product, partial [Ectocarpus sp. 12 AP-2014]
DLQNDQPRQITKHVRPSTQLFKQLYDPELQTPTDTTRKGGTPQKLNQEHINEHPAYQLSPQNPSLHNATTSAGMDGNGWVARMHEETKRSVNYGTAHSTHYMYFR